MKEKSKSQYLWGLFFLGLCLLNYPLIHLYNIPKVWNGVPVFFLFLFAFWVVLIVLIYWIIHKADRHA